MAIQHHISWEGDHVHDHDMVPAGLTSQASTSRVLHNTAEYSMAQHRQRGAEGVWQVAVVRVELSRWNCLMGIHRSNSADAGGYP
jgi:hypothetical protein